MLGTALAPSSLGLSSILGAAAGKMLEVALRPADDLTGAIEFPFDEHTLTDRKKFAGPYPREGTGRR